VQVVLASISPLAFVLMAGFHSLAEAVPEGFTGEFASLGTGFVTGTLFLSAQIAALAVRWFRIRRSLIENGTRPARSAAVEPMAPAVAPAS
jgi:hypothetical protein